MKFNIWIVSIVLGLISCTKSSQQETISNPNKFLPIDIKKSLLTSIVSTDTGFLDHSFLFDSGQFEFKNDTILGLTVFASANIEMINESNLKLKITGLIPTNKAGDSINAFVVKNPSHIASTQLSWGEKNIEMPVPVSIHQGSDGINLEGKLRLRDLDIFKISESNKIFLGFKVISLTADADKMAVQ